MTFNGLLPSRHCEVVLPCLLVWICIGCCYAIPSLLYQNTTTSRVSTNFPVYPSSSTPTKADLLKECSRHGSSCLNCSQEANCAWCFADETCRPIEQRNIVNECEDDDWYYGDCDKPEKEAVLVYVLIGCALFLLLIVILLVLYIFFCKMPRNKDYEPVSTKEKKKKRRRTPLMSKKVKPSGSRTDELKKKYQLDGE